MAYKIIPYGSAALLIQFDQAINLKVHQEVISYYDELKALQITGVISITPAYSSITIRYNKKISYATLSKIIFSLTIPVDSSKTGTIERKEVKIPVCYDKSLALDLEIVQKHTRLSHLEIINLHTSQSYPVYMVGFTPGFPYLGGLDKVLQTPRKSTPRLVTPKGAVGIANNQTGIYPNESPGGWQIIGQTPHSIFTAEKPPLINIGDNVRFYSISLDQFNDLKDED